MSTENHKDKDNSSYSSNNHYMHENKITFDNVYGELEFYKKKCDVLEKDVFKSQTHIKKLEVSLKKSQDALAIHAKNVNNTSISFLLPSEFKLQWENLAKDLILEAFDCLYNDYFWLAHIIQDTLLITYAETNLYIKDKVKKVLEVLNIYNENAKEIELDKYFMKFRNIFQDNFSSIFTFTEEFYEKLKEKVRKTIKDVYMVQQINNEKITEQLEELVEEIEKKPMRILLQSLFKLCIYMLLHDPILSLNIPPFNKRKIEYYFFNKNEFINIEGFGNEQTPCAVILPFPILRKSFSFMGIKHAVYCLPDKETDETIIKLCEKNKALFPVSKGGNSSMDLTQQTQHSTNSPNIKKLNPNKSVSNINNDRNHSPIGNIKNDHGTIYSNTEKKDATKILNDGIKYNLNNTKIQSNQKDNNFTIEEVNHVIENEDEKNKKWYDHPLMINKLKKNGSPSENNLTPLETNGDANDKEITGSQQQSSSISPNKNAFRSNSHTNIKNNSRNSSICPESINSSLNKEKSEVINNQNKSSRIKPEVGANEVGLINKEDKKDTNFPLNKFQNNNIFSMVRNKDNVPGSISAQNSKQRFISDKRNETNPSKILDANRVNYPLKDGNGSKLINNKFTEPLTRKKSILFF
jgi:hypothetical protein